MKKYHFIIDKINKNQKLRKIFLDKYKNYPPHITDIFVVIGGDGFMLKSLKNDQNPFFPISTPTVFPPKVIVLGISGPWDREIRIPHVMLLFPGSRSCKKDENIIKNGGVECEVG